MAEGEKAQSEELKAQSRRGSRARPCGVGDGVVDVVHSGRARGAAVDASPGGGRRFGTGSRSGQHARGDACGGRETSPEPASGADGDAAAGGGVARSVDLASESLWRLRMGSAHPAVVSGRHLRLVILEDVARRAGEDISRDGGGAVELRAVPELHLQDRTRRGGSRRVRGVPGVRRGVADGRWQSGDGRWQIGVSVFRIYQLRSALCHLLRGARLGP